MFRSILLLLLCVVFVGCINKNDLRERQPFRPSAADQAVITANNKAGEMCNIRWVVEEKKLKNDYLDMSFEKESDPAYVVKLRVWKSHQFYKEFAGLQSGDRMHFFWIGSLDVMHRDEPSSHLAPDTPLVVAYSRENNGGGY